MTLTTLYSTNFCWIFSKVGIYGFFDEKVVRSAKARWKGCPAREGKMKKLFGQRKQDEKVVRSAKARWNGCTASEGKMKKLPGPLRLIILNLPFVNSYRYITDSGYMQSVILPISEVPDYHHNDTTADNLSAIFAHTVIFFYWVSSRFEFVHENKNGVSRCGIVISYKPW